MSFIPVKGLAAGIEMVRAVEPLAPSAGGSGADFRNVLNGVIGEVKTTQGEADRQMTSWMNGEATDLHQVATSLQKAELTFELAIEMRNKVMQAYQEVMRMQI